MQQSIQQVVREAEDNYLHGSVQMSEYVEFDLHDTIEKIDAYLNSRHISGSQDSLGRDKPFFNICTAAANIWYRATDIDRKDIRIMPDCQDNTALAFIATILLQQWMKDARFGVFLNEWGRTLARYGSAVTKFVERDGELVAEVVPWNRLIVDPIDFDALPRIEKVWKTAEQLRQMEHYDREVVDALIDARTARETLDGKQQDNQSKFIEVYEVHGMLPASLLTDEHVDDESDEVYTQQMHVVAFVQGKGDEFEDFTLYRGREAKDPYMITHLIKEDGRTLSIGAVEHLFEAQWMVNHSQKNIKDTLDLASKLIFQTSDGAYVGRNVLTAIETGQVMVHKPNEPLTRMANDKPDISALQNFAVQWQNLAQEITSTPDAMTGTTMPSGTPYSLGAFLGAQANSLFELMTENKGLSLEEMMRIHILPNLMKKMDTKDEVVALLDERGITEIDSMYVPREAIRRYNKEAKRALIDGQIPPEFDQVQMQGQVQQELGKMGNMRPFKPSDIKNKTWKEALKGFEMRATVEVTNENTDKQAVLATLSSVLQTIAANPMVLQDPNAKMVFSQILTETGKISPIQLSTAQTSQPQQLGAGNLQALTEDQNGTTATGTA